MLMHPSASEQRSEASITLMLMLTPSEQQTAASLFDSKRFELLKLHHNL
jgi:hypothetical protein